MKKYLFLLLMLFPFLCRAGHAAGIDLYYEHVTGNTYKVYMIVYGACRDPNGNYSGLSSDHPQINVVENTNNANNIFTTLSLNIIADSTRSASPYCPSYRDSTNCTIASSVYQGYTRFMYSGTVTLPSQSTDWVFRFTSSMQTGGCGSRLGRPGNLNNIVSQGGNNAMLEATLNNMNGNNSSPKFNTLTFSTYCANAPANYFQPVTDPNADSITYSLVPALYLPGSNCSAAPLTYTYQPGYSFDKPLGTPPTVDNFSFDTTTGKISFNSLAQTCVVVTKISEYKNGVLVGTVMRERFFKILNTCGPVDLTAGIDVSTLQGANLSGVDTITTCPGPVIKFTIPAYNTLGDTISALVQNIPPASSVSLDSNGTKKPKVIFSMNTGGLPAGSYPITVIYSVRGCPLTAEVARTYIVNIVDGGILTAKQLSKTNCVSKGKVQYTLANGIKPYTVTVMQGTTVLNTFTNTTGIVDDSLAAGSYTIKLSSTGLACSTTANLVVTDSGVYPFGPRSITSPVEYCRNGEAKQLIASPDSISTLKWYDPSDVNVPPVPTPSTTTSGTFYWYVSQVYKNCESEKDTIKVIVDQEECNFNVKVHNVITPNGDGKNDRWVIENLELYPNTGVQIYDKLGDKVYETINYQNDWEGGTVPSGMYYYVIKMSTPNKVTGATNYTGYLMIKR